MRIRKLGPVVAILTALALAFALTGAARAHPELLRSEPADGEVVLEPPAELRLWFVDRVDPAFSSVRLETDEEFSYAASGLHTDDQDETLLIVPLAPLPDATYAVHWRTLSKLDGHSLSGTIALGVGAGSTPVQSVSGPAPIPAGEAVLKWARLTAVALLMGAIAVSTFVVRPVRDAPGRGASAALVRTRRSVLRWGEVAGATAVVIGLGLILLEATKATGQDLTGVVRSGELWRFLTESRSGRLLCLEVIILLGLTITAWRMRRGSGALIFPVAVALAAGFATVHALSGHAAGVRDSRSIAIAIAAVHLLAAAVWAGGVLASAGALLSISTADRREVIGRWRAFSVLAGISFGVVAATGLYSAGQQVASFDSFDSTTYGRALLTKGGLIAIAGAVGLLNLAILARTPPALGRILRPLRLSALRRHLHVVICAEALLLALVLLAGAVLTTAPPARSPVQAPRAPTLTGSNTIPADDLLVRLSSEPGSGGLVTIEVINTRRPSPAEVTGVRILSGDGSEATTAIPVQALGEQQYSANVDPVPPKIEVQVVRSGLPDASASFDLVPQGEAEKFGVRGPLSAAAVIAIGATALGLAFAVTRRVRRSEETTGGDPLEVGREPQQAAP